MMFLGFAIGIIRSCHGLLHEVIETWRIIWETHRQVFFFFFRWLDVPTSFLFTNDLVPWAYLHGVYKFIISESLVYGHTKMQVHLGGVYNPQGLITLTTEQDKGTEN